MRRPGAFVLWWQGPSILNCEAPDVAVSACSAAFAFTVLLGAIGVAAGLACHVAGYDGDDDHRPSPRCRGLPSQWLGPVAVVLAVVGAATSYYTWNRRGDVRSLYQVAVGARAHASNATRQPPDLLDFAFSDADRRRDGQVQQDASAA
jgi:hypothetical protein